MADPATPPPRDRRLRVVRDDERAPGPDPATPAGSHPRGPALGRPAPGGPDRGGLDPGTPAPDQAAGGPTDSRAGTDDVAESGAAGSLAGVAQPTAGEGGAESRAAEAGWAGRISGESAAGSGWRRVRRVGVTVGLVGVASGAAGVVDAVVGGLDGVPAVYLLVLFALPLWDRLPARVSHRLALLAVVVAAVGAAWLGLAAVRPEPWWRAEVAFGLACAAVGTVHAVLPRRRTVGP